MQKDKIRVGIVGGNFGNTIHLPAFKLDPRCEVVGIAASSYERSKALSTQHSLVRAYNNWEELVLDDEIDAVSIAVPPVLQPEIAMAALKQGKSVFAEKPLAASLEQAEQLYDLSVLTKIPNIINFHLSALESWIKAKHMLQDGKIGCLQNIIIQCSGASSINSVITSWKGLKGLGSGTLYDMGSHFLHALEWFAGPIIGLNAKLFSSTHNPSLDTFDILAIEFASGAAASIIINRTSILGTAYKIEFSGTNGTLILENKSRDVHGFCLLHGTHENNKLELICPSSDQKNINPVDGRIYTMGNLVKSFLDWIISGKSENPSFMQGVNVQRLLEAAYISDESGQWVRPKTPFGLTNL